MLTLYSQKSSKTREVTFISNNSYSVSWGIQKNKKWYMFLLRIFIILSKILYIPYLQGLVILRSQYNYTGHTDKDRSQIPEKSSDERHYFTVWNVEGPTDCFPELFAWFWGQQHVGQLLKTRTFTVVKVQPERFQLLRPAER